MKKRPRGNSRSKVLVEHDMIALVERMQLRNEDAKDAGKALGIPATTAQRMARKGLLRVLGAAAKEKIKAIANADSHPNPTERGQFELPSPEPSQAPSPVEAASVATPATPVELPPQVPTPEPEPVWQWEHLMSFAEFQKRDPHRQTQLVKQWIENEALGGERWKPVLRGRPNHSGVCFSNCPAYACRCHDEGPFEL